MCVSQSPSQVHFTFRRFVWIFFIHFDPKHFIYLYKCINETHDNKKKKEKEKRKKKKKEFYIQERKEEQFLSFLQFFFLRERERERYHYKPNKDKAYISKLNHGLKRKKKKNKLFLYNKMLSSMCMGGESSKGKAANMLDCDIIVKEFKLQL